ncbi:hypothetical protein P879_01859 [Paragonimus westermani]|uniref:Uncharacterized protein n=1 Tax=Paragonimus westermani TaxID=34504 RepID=A0A8T0DDR8_9TREM|nr:hypothetical protein P879_01859 [Paragonimus westermani]
MNAHLRSSDSWRISPFQPSRLLSVPPLLAGTSQCDQGSQTDLLYMEQLNGDNEEHDNDLQLLVQARPTAGQTDGLDLTDDDHLNGNFQRQYNTVELIKSSSLPKEAGRSSTYKAVKSRRKDMKMHRIPPIRNRNKKRAKMRKSRAVHTVARNLCRLMHQVSNLNNLLCTKPRVLNNTSNSYIKELRTVNTLTKVETLNGSLNQYSTRSLTPMCKTVVPNSVVHNNGTNKHTIVDAVKEDNLQSTGNIQSQQIDSAESEISQSCLTISIPEASLSSTLDSDVKALVDTDLGDSIQSVADSELKSTGSSCEFEDSLVDKTGSNQGVNGKKQWAGFTQHQSESETSSDFEDSLKEPR